MKVIKCFYHLSQFCRDQFLLRVKFKGQGKFIAANICSRKYLLIRTGATLIFLISTPKFARIVCFLMILVLLLLWNLLFDRIILLQ